MSNAKAAGGDKAGVDAKNATSKALVEKKEDTPGKKALVEKKEEAPGKSNLSVAKTSEAKKELKCGLCSDKFHEPKLLSCLHSFCLNCLRRYVEKGKFKTKFPCPLCNRNIEIPKSGGVKSLQANMYLAASESVDKTPGCDICDEGSKALERCLDCEENMCANCLSYHNKMKATRVHRTAPIGDNAKSKPKIQQKQFCDQHAQGRTALLLRPVRKDRLQRLQDHQPHGPPDA